MPCFARWIAFSERDSPATQQTAFPALLMLTRCAINPAAKSLGWMKTTISKDYWKALQVSYVFQVLYGLLAAMCFDGGGLLQMWCFSMAGFWGTFILVISRRPQSPTKTDLFFVRWSFPILFPFGTMLIAGLVWRLRGVL
jgi:hypothetical protein